MVDPICTTNRVSTSRANRTAKAANLTACVVMVLRATAHLRKTIRRLVMTETPSVVTVAQPIVELWSQGIRVFNGDFPALSFVAMV